MHLKSLLREPLLHFAAIGAVLFLYFHFSAGGSAGPGSTRIVLTALSARLNPAMATVLAVLAVLGESEP